MNDVVPFESRETRLNQTIQQRVEAIRARQPFKLPEAGDVIVAAYVEKIEDRYDVSRAKTDTDHAIDLLYIAYNTTPQKEGEIRVQIEAIMDKLIAAQRDSAATMKGAIEVANNLAETLKDALPDWLSIKKLDFTQEKNLEKIRKYFGQTLPEVATDIKNEALKLHESFMAIAHTYDAIISDTAAATAKAEVALGKDIEEKKRIEQEVAKFQAEADRIDSLVKDLQAQVTRFDNMAKDFAKQAEAKERTSFILAIIAAIVPVLAAALPAMAMASTGGGSYVGAGSRNTRGQDAADKGEGDQTTKEIETRKKISESEKTLKVSNEKVETLKKEIKEQEDKRAKLLKDEGAGKDKDAKGSAEKPAGEAPAGKEPPQKASGKEAGGATPRSVELAEIDKTLAAKKDELEKEQNKIQDTNDTLAKLKKALDGFAEESRKIMDEQQGQAAKLRQLQKDMLDKAEKYETERRTQAAELVKIKVLLKANLSDEETIHLAIQSLNVSISALKRVKEIVVEIAAFFKSFADFMDHVARDAGARLKSFEKTAKLAEISEERRDRLFEVTDSFFIEQSAEWRAVTLVAEQFVAAFADGWSKLNKLSGKYIYGDDLVKYLKEAADRIQAIADAREAAAKAKTAYIAAAKRQAEQEAAAAARSARAAAE